jgi:hypothetical protein
MAQKRAPSTLRRRKCRIWWVESLAERHVQECCATRQRQILLWEQWTCSMMLDTNMNMPEFIPAAPRPLTARPKMKAVDVGEAAVRIEPTTKMAKENT